MVASLSLASQVAHPQIPFPSLSPSWDHGVSVHAEEGSDVTDSGVEGNKISLQEVERSSCVFW